MMTIPKSEMTFMMLRHYLGVPPKEIDADILVELMKDLISPTTTSSNVFEISYVTMLKYFQFFPDPWTTNQKTKLWNDPRRSSSKVKKMPWSVLMVTFWHHMVKC